MLPLEMTDFLRAPFPFIMGLVWFEPTTEKLNLEDDVVIVDLDRDHVSLGTATSIAPLPSNLKRILIDNLFKVVMI